MANCMPDAKCTILTTGAITEVLVNLSWVHCHYE